jgi:hypothetical protein
MSQYLYEEREKNRKNASTKKGRGERGEGEINAADFIEKKRR